MQHAQTNHDVGHEDSAVPSFGIGEVKCTVVANGSDPDSQVPGTRHGCGDVHAIGEVGSGECARGDDVVAQDGGEQGAVVGA